MLQESIRVSIVAPCYNEAEVITEFVRRASLAAKSVAEEFYEIVLVDDGSHDGTWTIVSEMAANDSHIVLVRLMRNYGHQAAATAGLSLARGERILLIDADLQDPPELLAPMMSVMDGGADVVYGQRAAREGESRFKRVTASVFYRLLGRLASIDIPRDTGDFRLMSRRVVDGLSVMPERQRFIRGMVSWIGGKQVPLVYARQSRYAGSSKYPLKKMIAFAVDAITSFSAVPLRLASYLGLLTAFLALALLVFTFVRWSQGGTIVGWSSVMTAIVLFSGAQLVVLGILGEYVSRLFVEVKRRPNYLISEVIVSGTSRVIPVEFCNMQPAMQRSFWHETGESEHPCQGIFATDGRARS